MSASWNTKWGSRRVRQDPPTMAEAIAAAQGLTDDREHQAEIAAMLMGTPLEEAKSALRKLSPRSVLPSSLVAPARNGLRTVVVERRTSRRIVRPT